MNAPTQRPVDVLEKIDKTLLAALQRLEEQVFLQEALVQFNTQAQQRGNRPGKGGLAGTAAETAESLRKRLGIEPGQGILPTSPLPGAQSDSERAGNLFGQMLTVLNEIKTALSDPGRPKNLKSLGAVSAKQEEQPKKGSVAEQTQAALGSAKKVLDPAGGTRATPPTALPPSVQRDLSDLEKAKKKQAAQREPDISFAPNSLGRRLGEYAETAKKYGFGGTADLLTKGQRLAGAAQTGGKAGVLFEAGRMAAERGKQALTDLKEGAGQVGYGLLGTQRGDTSLKNVFGGADRMAKALGPLGLPIRPFTKLGEVVFGSIEKLRLWTDHLHNANMQWAEFSAAMSRVQADQEIRDIQYARERGDRRAGGAQQLAEARSRLRDQFAPFEDLLANVQNRIGAGLSNLVANAIESSGVNAWLERINNTLEGDAGGDAADLSRWMAELGWTELHGRPPHFPPAGPVGGAVASPLGGAGRGVLHGAFGPIIGEALVQGLGL